MMILLCVVLFLGAAVFLYLCQFQQRLLRQPLRPAVGLPLAGLCLVLGLLCGGLSLSGLALCFVMFVTLMLGLGLVPLLTLVPGLPCHMPAAMRNGSAGRRSAAETQRLAMVPHWWLKTLSGLVGGFMLTLALVGLFAWFGPGGIQAAGKVQFNMWMISPVWLLILSFTFLFRTGWRALIGLAVANGAAWSMLLLLRGSL